jgi:single-stranded-DNA-specific exonuclease
VSQDWRVLAADTDRSHKIAAAEKIPPILAQVLLNRGVATQEDVHAYLRARLVDMPDPFSLPGIREAVAALINAIHQKERVFLFGDYDVDGITGSSILHECLTYYGLSVSTYIPNRSREGYGLNIAALDEIKEQGAEFLITIDTGTTAFTELDHAKALGLKVIVVDHHESPNKMPACVALINPKHPESEHPDKTLCSAGLCFNLAIALRAQLRSQSFFLEREEPDLRDLLDLVCLGTIADMVPLQGQNRLLVRYGLQKIVTTKRPGMQALKLVSDLSKPSMNTADVSFRLAPRLNAAGRLADAKLGVQLLTTQDDAEASRVARRLDGLNQERRHIETQIVDAAMRQADALSDDQKEWATVVAAQDWHPGVIGIVAARLVEAYKKPAIVIALQGDQGMGSCRTYAGVDLYACLSQASHHLSKFGGHQAAAGLSIESTRVTEFRKDFQAIVKDFADGALKEELKIDGLVQLADLNAELVEAIQQLAPFGMGNRGPLFISEPVRLMRPRIVGKGHLRVTVTGETIAWPAIGFGLAEEYEKLSSQTKLFEVAYVPEWNEFRGERTLQMNLKALRPAYPSK